MKKLNLKSNLWGCMKCNFHDCSCGEDLCIYSYAYRTIEDLRACPNP